MKLLAYTTDKKKIYFHDEIQEIFHTEIQYLDEFPTDSEPGEMLLVELDEIPKGLAKDIMYTNVKFVYFVDSFFQKGLDRLLPLGGNLCVFKNLNGDEFLETLYNRLRLMEIYKLFHFLSRADMELFRFINRAQNGEKNKIADFLYGSTSENTMDVSLSRLRKKLREDGVGNDFFRIVTNKGRLYLTDRLKNYQITFDN